MSSNPHGNYQPIFILPEGSQRNTGKDAQRMNINAAKIVAETVRTTLGPKGMDKMLVDSLGEVTVTNDGVTILKEMNIEHPSAKMIVEVAKTQEDEVGDGTTTAVVLAGELLKRAESLLEQDIHPTVIAKGYRIAAEKAQVILNSLAQPVSPKDTPLLGKIASTAMTGKGAENTKGLLSDIAIKAVRQVTRLVDGKYLVDLDDVKLEKKVGSSVEETELIPGVVMDKERVHASMPTEVKAARIALIDSALEIRNTEVDAKISITDPEKMQAFLDMEEGMLRKMVEVIAEKEVNVVFCQKGVDDLAQHFFAKRGIYVVRRVKKSDMEKLAKATGATIVSDLKDLSSKDLGAAGVVEEVRVGDEGMTYVRGCKNPRSVTILIRGGTEHVIDEVKRALDDALGDIAASLRLQKVVAGAGAPEIELARDLRHFAEGLSGREQLAVKAFAEAMEIIPRTLAENAGLDPIDVLTELKAAHDKGRKWAGINVFTGKVMDAWKEGVIEPLKIKTQAVSSAAEVAVMILRIDDVILSEDQSKQQPPQGQYPGMPEM
ncbi:TCP-1/cpn60 chaperonin family protein [Candidatus Woesearchaeota archaeon]|nr:TCP-1/cpn60 chaperonin family protein [Candidatus Woesearchaeota archaeon]